MAFLKSWTVSSVPGSSLVIVNWFICLQLEVFAKDDLTCPFFSQSASSAVPAPGTLQVASRSFAEHQGWFERPGEIGFLHTNPEIRIGLGLKQPYPIWARVSNFQVSSHSTLIKRFNVIAHNICGIKPHRMFVGYVWGWSAGDMVWNGHSFCRTGELDMNIGNWTLCIPNGQ